MLPNQLEEAIRANPVILAKAAWLPKRKNLIALWPCEALCERTQGTVTGLVINVQSQAQLDMVTRRVLALKGPQAN